MLTIAVYRVHDQNRRARLIRFLNKYGERLTTNCHQLWFSEKDRLKVCNRITEILDGDDWIRLYRVCKRCIKGSMVYGQLPPPVEKDVIFYSSEKRKDEKSEN